MQRITVMTMSEHDEQTKLFEWARYREGKYPELALMFAIPNGGHRHITVAKRMKAEGVKAGVPDVLLPVMRGGYHSLWIELKHGKNKATDSQQWWLDMLNAEGHKAVIAYEFEGARDAVLEYLDAQ